MDCLRCIEIVISLIKSKRMSIHNDIVIKPGNGETVVHSVDPSTGTESWTVSSSTSNPKSNPNPNNISKFLVKVLDATLCVNCFVNVILGDSLTSKMSIFQMITLHPYMTSFQWIMGGSFWSGIALLIKNICGDVTTNLFAGVMMNMILGISNYRIYKILILGVSNNQITKIRFW